MKWGVALLGVGLAWMAIEVGAQASPVGETVVVGPVQGSAGIRQAYEQRLHVAIVAALEARGFDVADGVGSGQAVASCGGPECVEARLGDAGATFAVIPAMWERSGRRRELTLTMVGKSGRNLNAGTVLNGDLSSTTAGLIDELLAEREAIARGDDLSAQHTWTRDDAPPAPQSTVLAGTRQAPDTGHAWKTGPIVLWVGGAVVFTAVGGVAATRSDSERINGGALAGWFILGGSAIAGGTAWWVVGTRRRERRTDGAGTEVRVSPRGFDLRVRF